LAHNQETVWEKEGLTAEEYQMIVARLGRKPNYTELGMFGVMWSEHCSYKNSKLILKKFPTEGKRVLQGPGENAGIIDIGDNQAISFKIESHNHPSAIEPYQGAATGVGGIIRDIFTMGARPIASLNSLRFGNLNNNHVKYLFKEVVAGIAGYGNSIGIPTVGGEVNFAAAYQGNPLVNAMSVGLMEHDDIATGTASGKGNPVMVVGAATGRDGIQGASFASDELTDESAEDRPAVQVGDPFMEKLLLEASLELIKSGVLVGIQDMGAAGLISSSSEMAGRGGAGIEMEMSKVPCREEGMTPYEMLLSESQERMLVVPRKGKEKLVEKIFAKYGLHAAVIGKVTADGMIRVLHDGEIIAEVPAKALADDAPVYQRDSSRPAYLTEIEKLDINKLIEANPAAKNYNQVLLKLLASANIASKKWVYEQYDQQVQNNTLVLPGSDAAVLRIKGKNKGLALTTDCNGRYCYLNPKVGGRIAVAEAARNIVCSGGEPLAITDGLNFGNPMDPEVFWQFEEAAQGISEACLELETPVTGGNVSFYNESPDGAIYPTPIIGMVGLIRDLQDVTTHDFKDAGDQIILLGETKEELGGTEYLKEILGEEKGSIPEINLKYEKRVQQTCLTAIRKGFVKSAHDCSEGGLAVALAESTFRKELGIKINLPDSDISKVAELFGETQSRIIITTEKENLDNIQNIACKNEIAMTVLGTVIPEKLFIIDGLIKLDLEEMKKQWQNAIPAEMES